MHSPSSVVKCKVCGKSYSRSYFPHHSCKGFTCEFCSSQFTSERFLINHLCEQKRRFLQRDEPSVRLAFATYQHFYTRYMRQRTLTHKSFSTSPFYNAFLRFAKYALSLNMSHPLAFVDFLLRVDAPIDKWTQPDWYARYIRELNKNETPMEAIERNFLLMQQWSIDTGHNWRDFFRLIAAPLATLWIINGRISPWLLFTASSAVDLMRRFNKEQQQMVDNTIDIVYWKAKIARHQESVDLIRGMLAEHNI